MDHAMHEQVTHDATLTDYGGKSRSHARSMFLLQVGAGIHCAFTARWNDKTDGKMSVQWENKTTIVLAAVYWLAV